MNLVGYIEKFGSYQFADKSFNNVDAAVFVSLSYLEFDKIAPSILNKNDFIVFKDISNEQIDSISALKSLGPLKKSLITAAINSKRFRNVTVQYVMNVKDNEYLEQFFGVTFHVPDVGYFIAFRGTDGSIIGWKENFNIAVHGATAAQIDSVDYISIVHRYLGNVPLIVGGHSKGGNLAYYATLYSSEEVSKNIVKSFSFDGTGFFSKKYRELNTYEFHYPHLVQIVPQDSIVGEIFYTPNNHIVICSNERGMKQHNPFSWEINDSGDFVRLEKRTFKSRVFHRAMKKWTQNGSIEEKKLFIEVIFTALADENDNFAAFGNGESSLKKIIATTRKICNLRQKFVFYIFTLKLAICFISSYFYYIFKILKERMTKSEKSN